MFTTRPEIAGTFGVVASTHWLASQCGMAVLERGGNAFDAAVAAGFTLLFVAMLGLGGLPFISLGILGTYIGRIYGEVKQRPLYVVSETVGCRRAGKPG